MHPGGYFRSPTRATAGTISARVFRRLGVGVLTLAWLVLFLGGVAAIVVVAILAGLLRFMFGRSTRLQRPRPRRRGGFLAVLARISFVVVALGLLVAGLVVSRLRNGDSLGGCSITGAFVECTGFPGAGIAGVFLSLPARLADGTNVLLAIARAPGRYLSDGLAGLPVPPADLALGAVGPLLILLAWIGFAVLLADLRRLWRAEA